MSQRGVPAQTTETTEDPALETEHDDATGTGDEGEHDELDPDAGDGDEGGRTEDGQVEDDAGTDGDGRRAAEVKSQSRQRRVETATRIAADAKREAEALRRELAEIRAAQQGRQTQEQQELERQRVALMSPDEKLEHYRQQDKQELDRRFAQLNFTTQDANDRARFDALCAKNPAYASVQEDVEAQLAEARRGGANLPRETIATYLVGKRALERAGRAKPKQQRAGAERLARETVKPPGGGNNVRAGAVRGSEASQREKRLEGIEI